MSESEVSQIQDEDALRRMWQATEDFGRKKEIRAHMYRLREERLRNLYSPEPTPQGKGCEFSGGAPGHGQSFADQSFQSMKSKEVRDAASPPKDFSYRGQDLKERSNAGWNVESEDRTTDNGRTNIKFVNANVEGQYDVEGGRGQFAAVDRQRRAVTEHQDANSSCRRDETSSNTAAHEHLVRQADDGSRICSTTSSSNTSSKFQQVSSTKQDALPIDYDQSGVHDSGHSERISRITNTNDQLNIHNYDSDERATRTTNTNDYDQRNVHDSDRNVRVTKITNNDYDHLLRNESSELVSRKVEYPDDNTKVIVETRVLPDGSRVTSTRREFRAPVQGTRSEYNSRSESKIYSSHQSSDVKESTSNSTRRTFDNRAQDIVDSQRHVDDIDFKRQLHEYTSKNNDDNTDIQQHVTKTNRKTTDYSQTDNEYTQKRIQTKVNSKVIDQSINNRDDRSQAELHTIDRRNDNKIDETDRHHTTSTQDYDYRRNITKETPRVNDSVIRTHNISKERENEKTIINVTTDRSVVENKFREIPKDRTVSINIEHGAPKNDTSINDTVYDSPMDKSVPFDRLHNAPRKETTPVDRFFDAPKDEKVPLEKPRDGRRDKISYDEKVHHIIRDSKVEEVIETKNSNEHYQTTYQNDYQTRKVSTDWSPTHQAWASTLRADTPPTTHPSTRASSPGSRTYKSSTSSLRSSVSPDKSHRKPSSRGSSPTKVDRYSPTRTVTSDRYSHSTYSVTEERNNRSSPERKPPTGRSPPRSGCSPDRQRLSVSPEKQSNSFDWPNSSPERKPFNNRPRTTSPLANKESSKSPTVRQSPERKPTKPSDGNPSDTYPQTSQYRSTFTPDRKTSNSTHSSPRPSLSPDRKPGYQKPTVSPASGYSRTTSPSRPRYPTEDSVRESGTSPDRKASVQQPSTQKPPGKRPSSSPDRKTAFARPTSSNQPDDRSKSPTKKDNTSNNRSPKKEDFAQSPDRKPQQSFKKTTKTTEDHYRFVDEETKVYNQKEKTNIANKAIKAPKTEESRPCDKTPSQMGDISNEDLPDYCQAPQPCDSPFNVDKPFTKDTDNTTENDELYGRINKTIEAIDVTTKQYKQINNITTKCTTRDQLEGKDVLSHETYPSKYETYDKKNPRITDESLAPTDDTKDISSLARREKPSKNMPDTPSSPRKKSPSDSVSPLKSPTKETKYKHSTDFISTEMTREEMNKKTNAKDRPRQLVTPSTSPTRKPKQPDTEPSTGQSSPTTSVSGFVYFGSPRTEKPMVTDLDELAIPESTKKPETLNVKESSSSSKIPCRSPSPEKHVPASKDSLPRKSSLKKPTTDFNQSPPIEKPPTSFRVSPTDDKPIKTDLNSHKVVKKDLPSEPETAELATKFAEKQKPPLQRRETYDDRCKKILGLVDDTTTETVSKETIKHAQIPDTIQTSPCVSPCVAPNESLPFSSYSTTNKTIKVDVTDFINQERDDLTNSTVIRGLEKDKTASDSSPTKVQDIVVKTTIVENKNTKDEDKKAVNKNTKTDQPSLKQSPEKVGSPDKRKDYIQKRPSESPEKVIQDSPKLPQPTQHIPITAESSPQRKHTENYPKSTTYPTRERPEKVSDYETTNMTSTLDATTVDDYYETTKITKTLQPTRELESPTRDTSTPRNSYLPSKHHPKDESSLSRTSSPERNIKPDHPKDQSKPETVSSEKRDTKVSNFTKYNTVNESKFDSKTKDIDVTHVASIQEKNEPKPNKASPTRLTPQTDSSSKPFQPSDTIPKRPDTSPQRKPAPVIKPEDKQVPGYMRTTKTTTTKFDQTTVSENLNEITKSTIEKKHTSSVSPTRKPTLPKLPSERRTPSPTKPSRPTDITIDRTPGSFQPSSPVKCSPIKEPEDKHTSATSPTRSAPKVPGYMQTTASTNSKHGATKHDNTTTENIQETSTVTDIKYSKDYESPSKPTPKSTDRSASEYIRTTSPSRPSPSTNDISKTQGSPDRKPRYPSKEVSTGKPLSKYPKGPSPTNDDRTPGYIKTTTATDSQPVTTSTTEDIEENMTLKHATRKQSSETVSHGSPEKFYPRTSSPSKPAEPQRPSALSPDRQSNSKSPVKDSSSPENKRLNHTLGMPSSSPERLSYLKPIGTHETQETLKSLKKMAPGFQSSEREPKETPSFISQPEELRQLRTPSPVKKTATVTETNTDFIMSEREQEILNKVQKSLRKLSPERKEKSPSRGRSPTKATTSLQDLDITTIETTQNHDNLTEVVEEQLIITSKVPRPTQLKDDQQRDQKNPCKPSRNVSPVKRTTSTPANKVNKTPESPTKSRSISPKKPVSHTERPQSPQQPKTSGIKPRDQIPPSLTRKPTPATLSTTRVERLTTDVKKLNSVTKQNVSAKTTNRLVLSPTSKPNELETKRTPISKVVKDNVSPKKDTVTRAASDIVIKQKKTSSPQRMKSKPEIHVSDMSTKTLKYQKPQIKEPHSKLPNKPKSATSLNTAIDDDDIIIDVQQSKSSRENSPDRICPTPINFTEDVGVPRFPDEVSEPDDELVKRTHHTIHETESVVDDIVEICEDEELFVKKSDTEVITEQDDSLLSVNDKVNKFTSKMHSVHKPKPTTTINSTKKRERSDFIEENTKSDECLLTVSEKVNKFAKGSRDKKDSRSPTRKITDEYDRDTVYTDDYTKLSVNDKAHLFVETAENIKTTKVKPAQKVERPDLSDVDECLKSDDCLLSVSDKVNKFVKTAEHYFSETQEIEEKESKINEKHEKIISQIVNDDAEETYDTREKVYTKETDVITDKPVDLLMNEKTKTRSKEPITNKPKDYNSFTTKQVERVPAVKITTLRSSEAVKKAKALFENISSTQKTTQKDTMKSTKLTDIGVLKKTPKTDTATPSHSFVKNVSPQVPDIDDKTDALYAERPSSHTLSKPQNAHVDERPRSSPNRLAAQSPEVPRSKSPIHQSDEVTTTKTVLSSYTAATRAVSSGQRPESPRPHTESPRHRLESDKPDKVPGYLRPTKTSQNKEEAKIVEDIEVSSRRGSGKFGVELRRTSVERSTVSSERRRSVEHHQPCIEDIFDLDLLEQMLEKVVGYEQRRRIRAQIRVAKNQNEHVVESNTHIRTTKKTATVPKTRSPERKEMKTPEGATKSTSQKTSSPERHNKPTLQRTIPDRTQPPMNGHDNEQSRSPISTRQRPQSPEKPATKFTALPSRTPARQPSPDKRRTTSPSKATSKPKGNRFNEYASAYMKKVGLDESDKIKVTDNKTKKITDTKQTVKHETEQITVQEFATTKSFTERTSSKEVIDIVQTNGKRSPSPNQRHSPERKVQFPDHRAQISDRIAQSPERRPYTPEQKAQSPDRKVYSPGHKVNSPDRLHQRTPSPDFKRPKLDTVKETVVKTTYDIKKKIPSKSIQDEKPSWITNRNLKKITSETRTFSSKKIESEKPKYRAPSPSKIIAKPTDVITSSYGPGPLDADGKPLFGIKALRNGATNFQVKGTVVRQEFHSRNGGEPEGTVSVTAYSSQPEELEQLLKAQGAEPPSRLHGLSAITTTKKFGGDTGNTLTKVHTKEDRASLEQFTHHDRRVEHLESNAYDTRAQETTIEEITEPATITNSKKLSRKDTNDKNTRKDEKISEVKRQKIEERREKMERREDKKTIRQSSVKSLTEKYIKSANDNGRADRSAYPKAGLILRTTTMRESVSSDDAHPAGIERADSEHSLCSVDDTVETTTTERIGDGGVRTTTTRTTHHHHQPTITSHSTTRSSVLTHHEPAVITKRTVISHEPVITKTTIVQEPVVTRVTHGRQGVTTTTERSFLDSSTKVSGVQDILTRMKNADIVIQEGDTTEDSEARALLNKFLGATVLMAGMQNYVSDVHQETVRSSSGGAGNTSIRSVQELDLDQCWDERLLKKLLDECTDYEQRRRLRARIRTLMAEQEACASAVTEALGAAGAAETDVGAEAREEEEVTVTSSVRRDSSDKTVSSSTTTRTSKVIEMTRPAPKPVSPFVKFRQLEKQNSTNSPKM